MIAQKIETDLKAAMLAKDRARVDALKNLKNTLQYAEVAGSKQGSGLEDSEVIPLLKKEAKKRREAIDIYQKRNSKDQLDAEEYELKVIEEYLPKQMNDEEISNLVDDVVASHSLELSTQNMGRIIGEANKKAAGQADGADIARVVKEKIK